MKACRCTGCNDLGPRLPASPLRVLHVIGGDDTGGAMSHLLPLLSALREAGCDAQLLCLGEGGLAAQARERGLPVIVLPMRSAHDLRVLRPLRHLLLPGRSQNSPRPQSIPWQIVHTHGMRAHIPTRAVVSTRVMPFDRAKSPLLAATVHSDLRLDYSFATARLYECLDRATLGAVNLIFCVSEALRALLVARGYPSDRMVVIRSGLEPERVASLQLVAQARRGIEGRPLRVGTVARLVKAKRLSLFLEMMAEIHGDHPGVEALVAGDGPERAALERLASSLGLDGVVRFLGRVERVEEVLGDIDVYVVTSVFEGGVSLAVLEAMAAGLPVVATAAGGVAEAVVDGETGFVVGNAAQHDTTEGRVHGEKASRVLATALAERVTVLLGDADLRRRMGEAGMQRVQEHFLAARAAAETMQAYHRLLEGHGIVAACQKAITTSDDHEN